MVGVRGLTLQLPGNHAVGWGYLPGTGSQAWKMAGGRGRKMRGSTGREEAEQRMKTWEGKEGTGIREGGGSWMLKQGSKGLTSLPPSFCSVSCPPFLYLPCLHLYVLRTSGFFLVLQFVIPILDWVFLLIRVCVCMCVQNQGCREITSSNV